MKDKTGWQLFLHLPHALQGCPEVELLVNILEISRSALYLFTSRKWRCLEGRVRKEVWSLVRAKVLNSCVEDIGVVQLRKRN